MGLFRKKPQSPFPEEFDLLRRKAFKKIKNVRIDQEELEKLKQEKNLRPIQKNIKNPKEYGLRIRALNSVMDGNSKKAIKYCEKAIKINPDGAYSYLIRGRAKGALGDIEEGITDFKRAIKLDNKYTDAYIERARFKTNLGDFQGAINDLDKAVELDPTDIEAIRGRGIVKMNFIKDYNGAILDFNRALRLQPDNFDIQECLYIAKMYTLKGGRCSICKKEIIDFNPNKNAFTPVMGDGPEIDVNKEPTLICDECLSKNGEFNKSREDGKVLQ